MNAAVVATAIERAQTRVQELQVFGSFNMSDDEFELAFGGMKVFIEEAIKANIRFTEHVETLVTLAALLVVQKTREYADEEPTEDETLAEISAECVVA